MNICQVCGFDRLVLIVQWNATRCPRCGKLTKLEPIKEQTPYNV